MMDFRFSRSTKIISSIVLFFFCWSFGGIFDIVAFAATDDKQPAVINKQLTSQSSSQAQPKSSKPEEKFQKTIDDITQIVSDSSTDTDTKKNKLKTKKSEIETLDTEIRKTFDQTEKKLKDEGLPNEILQRHYDFVKKYEDNLNELKNNLEKIEKAKTKAEVEAEVENTKKFLEKVKPPKKHIPLDPNKLPHRTAEPVWIEPRTSPEEFQKDSQQSLIASRQSKSILVASNGPLTGLLNSPIPDTYDPHPVLLAQATNVPTDADLAETVEAKFTNEIKEITELFNNDPVLIFEFIKNNFT
ncbi:MAG: hypothetical protein AB1480_03390 [Nitrospirota bacterium]